jgi:hypothetical protein
MTFGSVTSPTWASPDQIEVMAATTCSCTQPTAVTSRTGYFTYQCPTFTNWVVLHALGGVPAIKQTWIFHTAPPFLTYSELGGLPQDPHCGAESCPRSQEVAEGGFAKCGICCRPTGFPGASNRWWDTRYRQRRGTPARRAAACTAIAQPTDLIVRSRHLRTACLRAVRPTSCDRRLRHRFAPPIAAASD